MKAEWDFGGSGSPGLDGKFTTKRIEGAHIDRKLRKYMFLRTIGGKEGVTPTWVYSVYT